MKRILSLLLCSMFLIVLCSCSENSNHEKNNAVFYYRVAATKHGSETGLISSESRTIIQENDRVQLLNLYLSGPTSKELVSPFPAGTTVKKIFFNASDIALVLSNEFSSLSGVNLTIACVCLAKTAEGLFNITTVNLSVENALLGGQEVITITPNTYQLFDAAIG